MDAIGEQVSSYIEVNGELFTGSTWQRTTCALGHARLMQKACTAAAVHAGINDTIPGELSGVYAVSKPRRGDSVYFDWNVQGHAKGLDMDNALLTTNEAWYPRQSDYSNHPSRLRWLLSYAFMVNQDGYDPPQPLNVSVS